MRDKSRIMVGVEYQFIIYSILMHRVGVAQKVGDLVIKV